MSRGLGELQRIALRTMAEHEEKGGMFIGDESGRWLSLRVIKLWAWGTTESYHRSAWVLNDLRGTPEQLARAKADFRIFMRTGRYPEHDDALMKGVRRNLHGPFKRALELLVERGYARAVYPPLESWQYRRTRRDRYYQLTEKGKSELLKVHT
jgi:hypothetical protein